MFTEGLRPNVASTLIVIGATLTKRVRADEGRPLCRTADSKGEEIASKSFGLYANARSSPTWSPKKIWEWGR